jgi:hypothetical protein
MAGRHHRRPPPSPAAAIAGSTATVPWLGEMVGSRWEAHGEKLGRPPAGWPPAGGSWGGERESTGRLHPRLNSDLAMAGGTVGCRREKRRHGSNRRCMSDRVTYVRHPIFRGANSLPGHFYYVIYSIVCSMYLYV